MTKLQAVNRCKHQTRAEGEKHQREPNARLWKRENLEVWDWSGREGCLLTLPARPCCSWSVGTLGDADVELLLETPFVLAVTSAYNSLGSWIDK